MRDESRRYVSEGLLSGVPSCGWKKDNHVKADKKQGSAWMLLFRFSFRRAVLRLIFNLHTIKTGCISMPSGHMREHSLYLTATTR